jgi:hypothetical protein
VKKTVRALLVVSVLTLVSIIGGPTPEALAQRTFIVVPAAAFQGAKYDDRLGAITEGGGRTPVYFPTMGVSLCRMTLWARDNHDTTDVTARLMRKPLFLDGTRYGPAPEIVAEAASAGASFGLRRFDAEISEPAIMETYAYWLEISAPRTIYVTGLRLEIAPEC